MSGISKATSRIIKGLTEKAAEEGGTKALPPGKMRDWRHHFFQPTSPDEVIPKKSTVADEASPKLLEDTVPSEVAGKGPLPFAGIVDADVVEEALVKRDPTAIVKSFGFADPKHKVLATTMSDAVKSGDKKAVTTSFHTLNKAADEIKDPVAKSRTKKFAAGLLALSTGGFLAGDTNGAREQIKGGKKVTAPKKAEEEKPVESPAGDDKVSDVGSKEEPVTSGDTEMDSLISDVEKQKVENAEEVHADMQPYLDIIKDAQEGMTEDLKVLGANLAAAKAEAKAGRSSREERLQWSQIGEKAAQALTQFAAGLYGMKKGVDMSGLKFNPTDWAEKFKAARQDYLDELDQLSTQYGYDTKAVQQRKEDLIEGAKLGMGVESERVKEARRVQDANIRAAQRKRDLLAGLKSEQIKMEARAREKQLERESKERMAELNKGVKDRLKANQEVLKSFERGQIALSGVRAAVGDRSSRWEGKDGAQNRKEFGQSAQRILLAAGLDTPEKITAAMQAYKVPPQESGWFRSSEPITADKLAELDFESFKNVSLFLNRLAPQGVESLTSQSQDETMSSDIEVAPQEEIDTIIAKAGKK